MMLGNLWERINGRYQRGTAEGLFKRPLAMRNREPLVTFTFDDFPSSAFRVGGAILRGHGAAGTYYAAFNLIGQESPVGMIFSREEVPLLLEEGHELGCHTFHHCNAWQTSPRVYRESIVENLRAAEALHPGLRLKTHSYPIMCPRAFTKRWAGDMFDTCRGGGQCENRGTADLNYLRSFFIERSFGRFDEIKRVVDRNVEGMGWLIFSTHDVTRSPTPYGCTPEYFERTVACARESGARIATMAEAYKTLLGDQPTA